MKQSAGLLIPPAAANPLASHWTEELQQKYRVMIAGPTSASAILSSLRMGYNCSYLTLETDIKIASRRGPIRPRTGHAENTVLRRVRFIPQIKVWLPSAAWRAASFETQYCLRTSASSNMGARVGPPRLAATMDLPDRSRPVRHSTPAEPAALQRCGKVSGSGSFPVSRRLVVVVCPIAELHAIIASQLIDGA